MTITKLLLASALCAGTLGSAHAAEQTWRGAVLITDAVGCSAGDDSISPGKNRLAVFRPKLTEADAPSGLIITFRNGAVVGVATSTELPTPSNGSYVGTVAAPDATGGNYNGGNYKFFITPSTITAATPQINIKGTLTKFGGLPGCTLKFRGAFFNAAAP